MAVLSVRLSLSHVSWTASSASAGEPSMRRATAVRWSRVRAEHRSRAGFLSGHVAASLVAVGAYR